MTPFRKLALIASILILLVGCTPRSTAIPSAEPIIEATSAQSESTTTAEPPPGADHLVISEIMMGISGNNNYDFVELYNPTREIVDLQGYSLWYQLNAGQADTLLYSWQAPAYIPPHGHYLLLREKQEAGIEADAYFDDPLVPQRGSLALRHRGEDIIDQVAWGNTDAVFVESANAPSARDGISLERLPGAMNGNGQDTDDNAQDFSLSSSPDPQNSASPPAPAFADSLQLSLTAPAEAAPGSPLEYQLVVTNASKADLKEITLNFPVPAELEFLDSSIAATQADGWLVFALGEIAPGSNTTLSLNFTTPWKYTTINVQGVYADAPGLDAPVFGGSLRTVLTGGSVPIGVARTLLNAEKVIVEGTATMYTGGFYAGSSGTKFYIEDDSGGIQVYVPNGSGKVEIPLGATVRVQGMPQPYRGAIELVPSPENVGILQPPGETPAWEPRATTITALQREPDDYTGRLVTLSGEVTRVEEFSFSYEIDLVDESVLLKVYIDKLTEINVETVEVGQYYQLTGIVEMLDDTVQLYPRVQTDLAEVQPPSVTLEADLPVNYEPGQAVTLEITVENHLSEPLQNLTLSLPVPTGMEVSQISAGGQSDGERVTWTLPELEGGGAEMTVTLTGNPLTNLDFLTVDGYTLTYSGQLDPLTGEPAYSFPGITVPAWAIQGVAYRSPYLLQAVQTSGVVTGVFPELDGFWIQGEADEDPRTSQGLFVYNPEDDSGARVGARVGDLVTVQGEVHESHSETQLYLAEMEVQSTGELLPQAVILDPPVDEFESIAYYEALEGMLVQVQGAARAVSPTNKYGETAVVLPAYDIDHLMQGDENGMAIRLDDGSAATHTDQSTMLYAAVTGDLLSGISGPLAYNYGYYKIQPLNLPQIQPQASPLPELPPASAGQLRVMTWNVENLFDYVEPHPSDPALPTVNEYHTWLEKIAGTILRAGSPHVIGFQEVEHVGVLQDLAATPLLEGLGYQSVLLEGADSRGIDVGYLVRGDVQIMDVQQFPAPEDLTSRPPLQLQIQVELQGETHILYLLNNHFLSMSGGEKATEPRRVAQAEWNAGLVDRLMIEDPEAQVIVMGDLNSYYDSPPIHALRESGLVHAFDQLAPEERYTYIYQGVAQVLDHILVNENLLGLLARVDILHLNADFPLQPPGDTSPLHKSDHDPVVVTLEF
jgi:predicted extracellular nuclease